MSFVLDCSVTMAWCFEDEAVPETEALLEKARQDTVVVPSIWHVEVSNVLLVGERRGRVVEQRAEAFLATLEALEIETDPLPVPESARLAFYLARRSRLTAYDACYVELALRRQLPLATRDAALRDAAAAMNIPILPG